MVLFHLNGLGLFAWQYPADYAHASSTAMLAATLCLWNATLAVALRRRQAAGAVPHALALAFTFAAIAAAIRLSGPWMTIAWAAEGAAVVWVGLEIRRPWLRAGGALLMAGAIVHFGATQFAE